MVNLKQVKAYAQVLGKGFLMQRAPAIAAGLISELFREWNVDMAKIKSDVHNDRNLWSNLTPEQWNHLRRACDMLGDLNFLSADLIVGAISKDNPGIASFLVNSPMAQEWLERQVANLKEHLHSE